MNKMRKLFGEKEKKIFLAANIVLILVTMTIVWLTYPVLAKSMSNNPPTESTTLPTELQTTAPTVSETTTPENEEVIVPPETIPTTANPTETTVPDETPEGEGQGMRYHTVVSGENWYKISRKYYGTANYIEALAHVNGERTSKDYVIIDEVLTIPSLMDIADVQNELDYNHGHSKPEYPTVNEGDTEDQYVFKAGPYGYTYGTRPNPAIDITVDKDNVGRNYTGEVDTSTFEYVGEHYITGYDPYCSHCCSGTGLMASGVYAIPGYSVAAGKYPIGTTLYIEGFGFYVVEDRGVSGNHIDIAAPGHASCYNITSRGVRVYIVPNNN